MEKPVNAEESSPDELVCRARAGHEASRQIVFESCRTYLTQVAGRTLRQQLRSKLNPSDLVQETYLTAHRVFEQFRGQNYAALHTWLYRILINRANDAYKHHFKAQRRNVDLERPLGEHDCHTDPRSTPYSHLVRQERLQEVSLAIDKLPADYRQVIRLRNWERLPFSEIGRRMNRSTEAAAKLWARAISQLKRELESAP